MHLRAVVAALLLSGCLSECHAQGTQLWKETKAEDFEKGTGHGVAIRSDGMLSLSPASSAVATLPSTYIWDAAFANGRTLAATGAPTRLYSVNLDGKFTVLFEGKELQVQCVTVAADGTIYFAPSPDRKIYRLAATPNSTPQVFFDPKTKYIWALALDRSGNLYAATGDNGQLFKIAPNGTGDVFFKSEETHIRSLALDASGNLLAGSDANGLVYRLDPKGAAFVLFSAPKKELTALATDGNGNIYAASTGDKRAPVNTKNPTSGGSEVDKIAADGSSLRLWSSKEDVVYALAFDSNQNLLIGTGNKGRIYSVAANSSSGESATLLSLSGSQVTAFTTLPDKSIIATTSNLGKLTHISSKPADSGTFESDTFDAKTFARWGRVEARGAGRYELAIRTGNVENPDRNWSPWVRADLSGKAAPDVPGARFAQWRATLYPGALLDSVAVNYRPKNLAPIVDDLTVTVAPRAPAKDAPAPTTNEVTVKWNAHDDNNDELRYSLYYRPANTQRWIQLRDGLHDKQATLDPTLFPDGDYQIRLVASASCSHSSDNALSG